MEQYNVIQWVVNCFDWYKGPIQCNLLTETCITEFFNGLNTYLIMY